MSAEDAERVLSEWAANVARRDDLVRAANAAGVSKHRIHTLTGIARTTIDRILVERPMSRYDLARQVFHSLGDRVEDYDVDAIVTEIRATYGDIRDIRKFPREEYEDIVRRHGISPT
ncbi:hypothetical protein [Sphaerisporangium sp. TRM90804]|uniref:hypothetical protein n=1 Tax=Sphaerisporangium sp. TRM90804 TaxID=3031113 RepID=UPI00244D5DF6|nr:hypothetical protein [Sphaerisporangium sp. TRM90804]MDH2428408.1 hypothetical protein [Sphaerisporangium sp. TRM90804]